MSTQKPVAIGQNFQDTTGRLPFLHLEQIGKLSLLSLHGKLWIARHAIQRVVVVDLRGGRLITALLLIAVVASGRAVSALLIVSALLVSAIALFARAVIAAILIGRALRGGAVAQTVSVQLGHVI